MKDEPFPREYLVDRTCADCGKKILIRTLAPDNLYALCEECFQLELDKVMGEGQ